MIAWLILALPILSPWSIRIVRRFIRFNVNHTGACQIQAEFSDEIAEYSKFNAFSEDVAQLAPNENYESLVDIGQKCFVASVVEAPKSSVYVHVGLGFFAELTWPAAVAVSGDRIKLIQKKVSNTQDALNRVQADMAEVIVKLTYAEYCASIDGSVLSNLQPMNIR